MLRVARPPVEPLSAADVAALDAAWRTIVAEVGVEFENPRALDVLREAGQRVEGQTVLFDADWVAAQVALAPSAWTWHARNPARDIPIGQGVSAFAPAYGAPFVTGHGERRNGSLADLRNLVALIQDADELDVAGGVVVEAQDVPVEHRHLQLVRTLAVESDKPFMAAVNSPAAAEDSVRIADIALGGLDGRCAMTAIVNSNSPLRWDERMSDAMMTLAGHGQAPIVMPGALLGAMAPVTLAGGIAQMLAEAFAAIALIQCVRPGCPVLLGAGTPITDMQSGAAGFSGPELARGVVCVSQLARHYGLPIRALGGGLTTSQTTDAQAGWESMQVMKAALDAHADVIMHAAGWLDAGLVTGYEKLIADLDIIASLCVEYGPVIVDDEELAIDVIREVGHGGHFFGVDHTLARFRTCFHRPVVASKQNVERWRAAGSPTAEQRAEAVWRERLEAHEPPAIDPDVEREIDAYVAARAGELLAQA
ncbi:MAG: trimethylamine methyltransferase family protein [Gaiellales bacterium]